MVKASEEPTHSPNSSHVFASHALENSKPCNETHEDHEPACQVVGLDSPCHIDGLSPPRAPAGAHKNGPLTSPSSPANNLHSHISTLFSTADSSDDRYSSSFSHASLELGRVVSGPSEGRLTDEESYYDGIDLEQVGIDYEKLRDYLVSAPPPLPATPLRAVLEKERLLGSEAFSAPTYPRYALFSERTGFVCAESLHELDRLCSGLATQMSAGIFWLDVCAPTVTELDLLASVLRLHPLTLEELQLEEIREKCDLFSEYYSLSVRTLDPSSDVELPVDLHVIAGDFGVVSLHGRPLSSNRHIAKRLRALSARSGLASDWIVYALLDDVLEAFGPALRDAELEADAIDELTLVVTGNEQSDMLRRIAAARKTVTLLQRLLASKGELLRSLLKRCLPRISSDAAIYMRDLQEQSALLSQKLENLDEGLSRSHANYLAQISIEMAQTSNRMSHVMKKLTAFASVALPWSVISGIWGMNVMVPGYPYTGPDGLPGSGMFIGLVSAMAALSIVVYWFGRKYDWF